MLAHPDIHSAINLEAANEFKEGKYFEHAKQTMEKAMAKQQSDWCTDCIFNIIKIYHPYESTSLSIDKIHQRAFLELINFLFLLNVFISSNISIRFSSFSSKPEAALEIFYLLLCTLVVALLWSLCMKNEECKILSFFAFCKVFTFGSSDSYLFYF